MILESNSSKDAKVNSLFSLLLFAFLLPLLDEVYVIASSRFSCVSSPGFPAGVLAHFIINCSLFIVAFWLQTDIPLRWVLYQRCQNAPCSLPGQNVREESGCKEGEHRAADSGADSLTGEFRGGAIKPRKIPTEHLIEIGICFAMLTEYLQSVAWCGKGTKVAGFCV